MTNKELFQSLCTKINRVGMSELLAWLETTDFYVAPASTKYHGAYDGGLVEHCLDVYNDLIRLHSVYPMVNASEESLILVALFHDLCKVNMYAKEVKYRKNAQNQWEQYDAYVHNEQLHYGGHGSKSVFILQNFIQLLPEEAVAINCHMATWETNPMVGAAFEHCPLAWLLHVADESATFLKK